jgi:rod shape-determining protein MreC
VNNFPQLRNWIILITVVLLVITIGVTVNGRDQISAVENALGNVVRPLQQGLMTASNYIAEKTYPIRNVFKLADENEALKEELIDTQQALIRQTMLQEEYNELKTLRKTLNYAYRNDLNNYVTADVIARDQNNWYGMFVVNVGLEQGVTENAMVFNGSGLIGQVFEVGQDWSKVLTITDIKGTVSFQIVDDVRSYDGVVSGVSEDELEGYLFDPKGVIYPGDKLITSGLGVYPKGIIIGTVSEVVEDKDTLLKGIKVMPNVDFKNIDKVFIIPETHTFTE